MRTITRNVALVILGVVVLLLALGALPSLLKSGDPYYLTATPVEDANESINASGLSEQRYPFTTGALADATNGTGYSEPYWEGPFGVKGAFTHSPFDELGSLQTQYGNATDADGAFVRRNGTVYRLTITQNR